MAKRVKIIREVQRKATAVLLTAVLIFSAAFPDVLISYGSTLGDVGTVIPRLGPYMDNTMQCIDAYAELGPQGGYEHDGDSYVRVLPSSTLTKYEEGLLFWGSFFLFAVIPASDEDGFSDMDLDGIRNGYDSLLSAGLPVEGIYYQDFNRLIHNSSIQSKYPLIKSLAADDTKARQYLDAMGLMGGLGGEAGIGGRTVPSVFSGHMSLDTRLVIGTSLSVDTGDPEFLRQVKIEFAPYDDSENFSTVPCGGWSYVINGGEVAFSNPDEDAKGAFIRFNTEGTDYMAAGGSFATPLDAYEELLEVWIVENCNGGNNGGILEASRHQRFASLSFDGGNTVMPYAELGRTTPLGGGDGAFSFTSYSHEEKFTSHYNLKIFKGDYETGKPLSGASFTVYESTDGINFTDIGGVTTGTDGTAGKTVEHHETFRATFCDGHPAPAFTEVPEEETDPETGLLLNEDEILSAQEANMAAASGWLTTLSECEAFSGNGHYHYVMEGVSEAEISSVASYGGYPGDVPDAGPSCSDDGGTAFVKSGCKSARDLSYERFIHKEYHYTFREINARSGYVLHGGHQDDMPIEVIRTNSSEAGAVSAFTGKYSDDISTGGGLFGVTVLSASKKLSDIKKEHKVNVPEETEKRELSFGVLLKSAVSSIIGEGKGTPSEAEKNIQKENEETVTKTTESAQGYGEHVTPVEILEEDTSENVEDVEEVIELPVENTITEFFDGAVKKVRGLFTIESFAAEGTGPDGIFYEGYGESAYQPAGTGVIKGPSDNQSHCNDVDGEGNMWRVYDHRTEGEIHINKRDLDLSDNVSSLFDDYGRENGDGTLTGALYGLFAASDIIHPDGHTGVVYAADDLVSIAETDIDGNASFLVNRVGPDCTFDYVTGTVTRRNNRDISTVTNLYDHSHTETDYSEGGHERIYEDLKTQSGSEWIGRPLLLGSYYVKELKRSEGYELSIGKKDGIITNFGQDLNADTGGTVSRGMAAVSKKPWSDVQIRGGRSLYDYPDPGDHDYNEIYFDVISTGTGAEGFDMKLSGFPSGTKLYRLDEGSGTVTYEVGTGIYDLVNVLDESGNPVELQAVTGYDYPVYDSMGMPETYVTYPDAEVKNIQKLSEKPLNPDKVSEALSAGEEGMDEGEVFLALSDTFNASDYFLFVKAKTERILRANGRKTPLEGGRYSGVSFGSFDDGDTVAGTYGAPVVTVSIPGPLSNADLIESIVSFYADSAYFTYGGVKSVTDDGSFYRVELYAGTSSMKTFYTEVSGVPAVFCPVEHESSSDDMQRYVWAVYTDVMMTNLPDGIPVFGRYEAINETSGLLSAYLKPKASAKDPVSYDLQSYEEVKTRFYPAGTCPVYDALGNIIYKTEYRERKVSRTVNAVTSAWTYLSDVDEGGIIHIDTSYTDHYGIPHDDALSETIGFLAVVPSDEGRHVTLTESDIVSMGEMNACGYAAGDSVSIGEYYTLVKKVSVSVKTGMGHLSGLTGPESYIAVCDLDYPGQEKVKQDAGTLDNRIIVHERPVRQSVKVRKTIALNGDCNGDGTGDSYMNNTYGVDEVIKETNFRFKAYLKSNLERLSCDDDGNIVWVDEGEWPDIDKSTGTGDSMSIISVNVRTIDVIPGSRKILEVKDGFYNYEKFFDAVDAANTDKWDDDAPTYSSFRPIGNYVNRSAYQVQNAKRSDRVRQFAITWYLEDEVKALTRDVPNSFTGIGFTEREADRLISENTYQGTVFDGALYNAILKAEEYLRPFYRYDIDGIYSIRWDHEEGGGTDGDYTTLSADVHDLEETAGRSAYLPYGKYVIVEQQPRYTGEEAGAFNDFINKWYRTDAPKEIEVPKVYDGSYTHREIPYTLTVPTSWTYYDSTSFTGFSDAVFTNELYYTRLRIEKTDSETHEDILHDDAVFAVYKAERDMSTGNVIFYEADTEITGSKEFMEGYCRKETVVPVSDGVYKGIVAAGTPKCSESGLITLSGTDEYSTKMNIVAKKEETNLSTVPPTFISQNTGYLETPKPLGAGTYVLLEIKAPAGYVRSDPVAVEIYSDKVTYYSEGQRKEAPQFPDDGKSELFIEDEPIKLTVEKVKESSAESSDKNSGKTVTYRYSGRVDGSINELSDKSNFVYAFNDSGNYQGYAWKKGTLEYLARIKEFFENDADPLTKVEIVYNGNLFAGYGYITRPLLTADDGNKYVTGATLTLFEAVELERKSDREFGRSDHSFSGLSVVRDVNASVKGIKAEGRDILFYSLDSLEVTETRRINGTDVLYGYDMNHCPVPLRQLISDSLNYHKDDREISVYAFQGGTPVFELTGGNLEMISYSRINKTLTVDKDTMVYHLDADGNRDSLVDPYTGMAYVIERDDGKTKYLAWAVEVIRDESGNVVAMDKITTARTATIGENDVTLSGDSITVSRALRPDGEMVSGMAASYDYPETGSISGTWKSDGSGQSHVQTSLRKDKMGGNMNGEPLTTDNNGTFRKEYDPVYDSYGNTVYYQRSNETYSKGTDVHDRNGNYVRYDYSDEIKEYDSASYACREDTDEAVNIYHRYGEGYVLQNTWVTSEYAPNDPFNEMMTDGQADIIKRLPEGTYIMEELKTPDGYVSSFPVGVTVKEQETMQYAKMVDYTTKLEISKLSSETHMPLGGAELALFPARRIYSTDYEKYPKGYFLVKTSVEPVTYKSTEWTVSDQVMLTARWITTDEGPVYLEGIPEGEYILEELSAPDGFRKAAPVEIEIDSLPEVVNVTIHDDCTEVVVEKYCIETGTSLRKKLKGAEFTLHEAETDAFGNLVHDENGSVRYRPSVLSAWTSSNENEWTGFAEKFREAYRAHGSEMVSFGFSDDEGVSHTAMVTGLITLDAALAGGLSMKYPTNALFTVEDELGRITRVRAYGQRPSDGKPDFALEFQFDYKELSPVNENAFSYTSLSGERHFKGLSVEGKYVAVEVTSPAGYEKAGLTVIEVNDGRDPQKFYIRDRETETPPVPVTKETEVHFHKTDAVTGEELPGAHVEVRDSEGRLIDEWTSSDKPHEIKGILEAGKKYRFIETVSPDGYALSESVEFEVNDDGTIQNVYMEDKPVEKVPDPTLGPEPETTEPEETETHSEHETVPETTKHFTPYDEPSGETVKTSHPEREFIVTVRKTDGVSGKGVEGAEFTLYDRETGSRLMKLQTDESGGCVFSGLKEGGHYIVKETGAPEGYTLSPEERYLTVKGTYKNDAVIYWVDQPERFKKFGLLYATGDTSPSVPLLLTNLVALLLLYLFICRKEEP